MSPAAKIDEKALYKRLLKGFKQAEQKVKTKRLQHEAVLFGHGFTFTRRTKKGSYRYDHPNGARAYYGLSRTNGWRTQLRYRGMWGWTGRIYANATNLNKWMTEHK